jgi:hypothetical protein
MGTHAHFLLLTGGASAGASVPERRLHTFRRGKVCRRAGPGARYYKITNIDKQTIKGKNSEVEIKNTGLRKQDRDDIHHIVFNRRNNNCHFFQLTFKHQMFHCS